MLERHLLVDTFKTLNGLRFPAIMVIVVGHMGFLLEFFPGFQWIMNAVPAVDYFFMLSGFGLMYSALRKEGRKEGSGATIRLAWLFAEAFTRVRKIYPLYIITMLLAVPKELYRSLVEQGNSLGFTVLKTAAEFALCVPLLQGLFGVEKIQWLFNSAAWFLSCLFIIYLAAPFIIRSLKRIKTKAGLSAALMLDALMIAFTAFAFGKIEEATFFDMLVYASPYRRVFYVILGMLLCLLRVNFSVKPGSKNRLFNVLEIAAATIGLAYFFGNDMVGMRDSLGDLAYALDVTIVGTLLLVFSFEGGLVSKILSSKPLQTLGKMSMYIFLIHYVLLIYRRGFEILLDLLGLPPSAGLAICEAVFILVATFALSFLALKVLGKSRSVRGA